MRDVPCGVSALQRRLPGVVSKEVMCYVFVYSLLSPTSMPLLYWEQREPFLHACWARSSASYCSHLRRIVQEGGNEVALWTHGTTDQEAHLDRGPRRQLPEINPHHGCGCRSIGTAKNAASDSGAIQRASQRRPYKKGHAVRGAHVLPSFGKRGRNGARFSE